MGARHLELPTRVDLRPSSRRPELSPIEEPDEPTVRVYQSQVLQKLDRAPDLRSRVESQEHIRIEMLNAIVRANHGKPLAYAATVPFTPVGAGRFPTTRPMTGAPPLPTTPVIVNVRSADPWEQSGIRRRPFRRRSNAPLFAIFVAFAIFLGLAAQHRRHLTRTGAQAYIGKLAHQRAAKLAHPPRRR